MLTYQDAQGNNTPTHFGNGLGVQFPKAGSACAMRLRPPGEQPIDFSQTPSGISRQGQHSIDHVYQRYILS